MPILITQIISYIALAIQAAPTVIKVYEEGKALVTALFTSGLITQAQQEQVMSWCDAHQAATLAGVVPPEFVVDDPDEV